MSLLSSLDHSIISSFQFILLFNEEFLTNFYNAIKKQDNPSEKEPWQMTQKEWMKSELQKAEKELKEMKGMTNKEYALKHRGASRDADIYILENQRIPSLKAGGKYTYKSLNTVAGKPAMKTFTHDITIEHYQFVREALNEGKPVPEKVLADYPELQKEHVGV